jgi:hypothetical protein
MFKLSTDIMAIYGHRHLESSFEQLLEINQDGFTYKGNHYGWKDIKKIKRYDSIFWNLFFYQGGAPVAYVFLKDGKRIRIRGRVLERKGDKPNIDFVGGKSSAYVELMSIFQEKLKGTN